MSTRITSPHAMKNINAVKFNADGSRILVSESCPQSVYLGIYSLFFHLSDIKLSFDRLDKSFFTAISTTRNRSLQPQRGYQ